MLYYILRAIAALIFKIMTPIEVSGKKHIPKKGGFILVSNHVSYLDPVLLGVVCPRRLNYMAKQELFRVGWFSKLLSRISVFPVKRNTADLSALKEALRRLKNGEGLVVFPEGSRSSINRGSLKPQPGIGFLATKAEVPIIPSFIKGTDLALPKGAKFIRPNRINVYFGEQIHIERREPCSYQDIADEIMQCVRQLQCA